MKPLYSKITILVLFVAAVIILIVGAVKSINSMIIGGVLGLIISALIMTGLMINSTTTITQKEPVKVINNPLPDV
jgi:hypothetical protein